MGATLAYINGGDPLAGGSASVAAEKAAQYLSNQYDDGISYNDENGRFDPNRLPESVKEEIRATTGAIAAVVGATGDNGAALNAQIAGVIGQNAVENNSILSQNARKNLSSQGRVLFDRIIKDGKFATVEDFNYAYDKCPNQDCRTAVRAAYIREKDRFIEYVRINITDGKDRELIVNEFTRKMSAENLLIEGAFGRLAANSWLGLGEMYQFPDTWIKDKLVAQNMAQGMDAERADAAATLKLLKPQAIASAITGIGSIRSIKPVSRVTTTSYLEQPKQKVNSAQIGDIVRTPTTHPNDFLKIKGTSNYKNIYTNEIWSKSTSKHSDKAGEWKVGIERKEPTKIHKITIGISDGRIIKVDK